MSVHVEWMDTSGGFTVATAGAEYGDGKVNDFALVVGNDSVAVIEGSADELRALLVSGLVALGDVAP